VYEDPPLFASEIRPAVGPGIRQCIGPVFELWSAYLGDQWSIGAWDAMRDAAPERLPEWLQGIPLPDHPPQNLKEYDPEWGRAFWTGTVAASCDHERMLRSVRVPVLLTHHMRVTTRPAPAESRRADRRPTSFISRARSRAARASPK
jgi:hypothetical protein